MTHSTGFALPRRANCAGGHLRLPKAQAVLLLRRGSSAVEHRVQKALGRWFESIPRPHHRGVCSHRLCPTLTRINNAHISWRG